jgi:hypothetical protein
MYNLRPPDYAEAKRKQQTVGDLRVRMHTRLLTNVPTLVQLHAACNGKHSHVTAWGHCKCAGKYVSRASAAGAYPKKLCKKWAQLVSEQVHGSQ